MILALSVFYTLSIFVSNFSFLLVFLLSSDDDEKKTLALSVSYNGVNFCVQITTLSDIHQQSLHIFGRIRTCEIKTNLHWTSYVKFCPLKFYIQMK